MVQQQKFRLSDMIPNAWFYKLRDMRAQGRGGVGIHHRSSSARCYREVRPVQQPSCNRWSSARWNREVAVYQPADVVEQPVTPTKGSSHSPLPRRASYYYSTREREVRPPPRVKDGQSPTRSSSRRRNRIGHAHEGRGHVSGPVPVHGKEPVLDAPGSSCRRRDRIIESGSGEEPRRPTVTGPPNGGLNVKVIASEKEIIIDLQDNDAPKIRLRPITTMPARRQPQPNQPDGSHVALADLFVRDKDTPDRRLRPIAPRPARKQPELNEPEGSHVDLSVVTARASPASDKSGVSKPRRSSVSSSSGRRRLKTRVKSPRLAATVKRVKPPARNCTGAPAIADSYAVVMMSRDPRNDFRESMEEMIAAYGIRGARDLEDLLACYLTLNNAEHHDLIVEVFEQIWSSLASAKR